MEAGLLTGAKTRRARLRGQLLVVGETESQLHELMGLVEKVAIDPNCRRKEVC
jgi:hypothetical protein